MLWTLISTPIPQALVNIARRARRGPWLLTLWRLVFLTFVLLAAAGLVAFGGSLGAIFAFIAVSTLIRDSVRDVVADIWNANFYEVGR
jgi:hypothetical protein